MKNILPEKHNISNINMYLHTFLTHYNFFFFYTSECEFFTLKLLLVRRKIVKIKDAQPLSQKSYKVWNFSTTKVEDKRCVTSYRLNSDDFVVTR